jgi:CheY-like chemotaxis protein
MEVTLIIENVKILVADHEKGARDLMVNTLTYCVNRRVLPFETGQLAWEYLEDGGEADILFCEVDIPGMNGFELLKKIKEQMPGTICIIMSGLEANEKKAALEGADAFLGKPFSLNDLFNLVQVYVVD